MRVKKSGWLWFEDVVETEPQKCGELPEKFGRCQQQHAPERHDFIPDDGAVIDDPQCATGDLAGRDTDDEGQQEEDRQAQIAVQVYAQQRIREPGEGGARSAGGERRKSAAHAAGNEMGGMTEEKTPGRWRNGCRRIRRWRR